MKNFKKYIEEAYTKREARLTKSLANVEKQLSSSDPTMNISSSEYLFPEMNRQQNMSELEAKKQGLLKSLDVVNDRKIRRFIRNTIASNIKSSSMQPPIPQPSLRSVTDINPIINPISTSTYDPILLPNTNDPRWKRYGVPYLNPPATGT